MRSLARALVALLAIHLLSSPALAESRATAWLRERAILEWIIAGGGWRTAAGDGTEISAGLTLRSAVGLVATGRVLVGAKGTEISTLFIEGLGGLGIDLRVSDAVRLRGGVAGGRAFLGDRSAAMAGVFLGTTIDVVALGPKIGLVIAARFDYDALLGDPELPKHSVALTAGTGIRY